MKRRIIMKKVLSLVLASVMLLAALTACGESSGPAANSGVRKYNS